MGNSLLKVMALGLALSLGACSKYAFLHTPPMEPAPDASFYEKVGLSIGIWEQVKLEGNEFAIGRKPTYIEPLKVALDRMDLFGQISVAPWRPQQGDVFFKVSDKAQVVSHNDYNAARLWAIFLFAGIPATFLKLRMAVRSELTIESEPVPGIEPLLLTGTVETELQGKLLSHYGTNDHRLELGQRQSVYGAEQMATWLRGHYDWFHEARKAIDAAAPPAKPAKKK